MSLDFGAGGRDLRFATKLTQIHWGFVTILVIIAAAGVVMLYSVVGGSWAPYASAQAIRFAISIVILLAVAMVDLRVWMRLAYPAYVVGLLLLIAVEFVGTSGKGATRWIVVGADQRPRSTTRFSSAWRWR